MDSNKTIVNSNKMVCLGDSITWGYPYGPEYSWVALAETALGTPMINKGINGETALDLWRRFARDVISNVPSHVFIMAGTNDASIGVSLEEFKRSILQMTAGAWEKEIRPVLGLPIPSSDRFLENNLQKYRQWLTEYSETSGVLVVDFSPAMTDLSGQINYGCYNDEVHPSKAGYRAMAGVFSEFYQNVIR
ncbi:GDSL-type esterase/lipase family protein [Phosphitispora fastidiosa]|uniref:GDSL-type esterase/lipase family protein n=1 Tax=Phosphitispora fastidiosa TaxID=2837202 RepID=UPI001E3984A3|nr:GDSL-type esterase/lipase family protein [Phosphitispora fastidiosa]MBU7005359.1 lysophospholipase L1-like esterase [Phosphitispora fastidiosa]